MPNEKSNHNTNTDFLIQSVSPGEEYGGLPINKDCRNIIVKDLYNSQCPACRMTLQACTTLIPSKSSGSITGMRCRHCKTLYIKSRYEKAARKLLQNNRSAKEFTFNGEPIWQYSAQRKWENKLLAKEQQRVQLEMQKCESAFCAVIFSRHNRLQYCIVVQRKRDAIGNSSLYCRDPFALELLAAGLVASKKGIAEYNGEQYQVIKIVKNDRLDEQNRRFIIVNKARVLSNSSFEWRLFLSPNIVFIAMFSPYTNRYECAEGRLRAEDGMPCLDADALFKYLSLYGKPEAHLFGLNGDGCRGYWEFDLLPEESILRLFGYEVNQESHKSEQDRQKILSILMDTDLVQKEKILRHIRWLIGSRSSEKYNAARIKWQADLIFAENYEVNKERYIHKSN